MTVVSALTAAAKRGILIKGGSALESARNLKAIALDKTGTLTTGSPKLVEWSALDSSNTSQTNAQRAFALASRSDHPVSRAIATGLQEQVTAGFTEAQALQALPGRGVQAVIEGEMWTLANLRWVGEQGWDSSDLKATLSAHEQQGRTVTLLANSSGVQALFAVADPLRPQAKEAIAQWQALGVKPVVLSGDNDVTVRTVAAEAGISDMQNLIQAAKNLKNDPSGALNLLGDVLNIGGGTLGRLNALPEVTAVFGDLKGAAEFALQAGQAANRLGGAVGALRAGYESGSVGGWLDAVGNGVAEASDALANGSAAAQALTGWLAARKDK